MFIPIPHLTISMERARIGACTVPLRVSLWCVICPSLLKPTVISIFGDKRSSCLGKMLSAPRTCVAKLFSACARRLFFQQCYTHLCCVTGTGVSSISRSSFTFKASLLSREFKVRYGTVFSHCRLHVQFWRAYLWAVTKIIFVLRLRISASRTWFAQEEFMRYMRI